MLNYDGFRLIKIENGNISQLPLPLGSIKYEPIIKYKLEKSNAFDPSIVIKRNPYHEDKIECNAILNPQQYQLLLDFIADPQALYIEFDTNENLKQFPVTIDRLPQMTDSARKYKNNVTFSLISRYYAPLNYVNFDNSLGFGSYYGNSYGY